MPELNRDEYLDQIMGQEGAAQKFRRPVKALHRALSEEGITHKAYKAANPGMEQAKAHAAVPTMTKDPALQAKMHQAIVGHYAEKAGLHAEPDEDDFGDPAGYDDDGDAEPMPDGQGGFKDTQMPPLREDPEGPFEAENEEDQDDEFGTIEPGSLKTQPGYEEPDRGGEPQVPALVNSAITKRPGTFQPPVPEQISPSAGSGDPISRKALKGYVTRAEFARMTKEISDLTAAMREVAELVHQQQTDVRQASSDPGTVINNPDLQKAIKAQYENGSYDPFWMTNLQK